MPVAPIPAFIDPLRKRRTTKRQLQTIVVKVYDKLGYEYGRSRNAVCFYNYVEISSHVRKSSRLGSCERTKYDKTFYRDKINFP